MKKLIFTFIITAFTIGGTVFGQALGHLNSQKVLDTLPSRKAALEELSRFEQRAYKELEETQQSLQQAYMKLQEEAGSMSKTAYKFEEDRLMRKSQEFQQRQEELDQQLKMLANELNTPVLERLQE